MSRRPSGRAAPITVLHRDTTLREGRVLFRDGEPIGQGGPIGMSGAGGRVPARIDRSPRQLRESRSVLGEVIPVVYGTRKLAGLCIALEKSGSYVYGAWAFSEGEVSAISSITVNGEAVSSLDWVASPETHTGSTSQTVSTLLSAAISGFVEAYPGLAYVVLKLDPRRADLPGSLTVEAEVTGRIVTDFRDSSTSASSNPVVIAHDILTSGDPWAASVTTSQIDTTSWTNVADWCDDTMSDGTPRWSYNGIVQSRDPWSAAAEVLAHCFARPIWYDGTLYLVADRDGSASGVVISADDWVRPPKASEAQIGSRPTDVRVRYVSSEDWSERSITASDGTTDPSLRRREEITLDGATDASTAARWADQYRRIHSYEVWEWQGAVGPVAADVLPGDVITINTPGGVSSQLARVLSVSELASGIYGLRLREYDPASQSSDTATDDTPVHTGAGPDDPDVPTNIKQVYIEVGDLESGALVTADDLSGWTGVNGATGGNDATEDAAEISVPQGVGGGDDAYIYQDISPGSASRVLIAGVYKLDEPAANLTAGYCQPLTWWYEYEEDSTTVVRGELGFWNGSGDSPWYRFQVVVPVSSSATTHRLKVGAYSVGAGIVTCSGTSSWGQNMYVKRLRVVPYGARGGVGIAEEWTWTEGSTAADTVSHYSAGYAEATGGISADYREELGTVPQGSERAWLGPGDALGSQIPLPPTPNGTVTRWRSVGRQRYEDWPDITAADQSLEVAGVELPLVSLKDVDTSNKAAAAVLAVDSSNESHEYVAQGSGGGLDADTLDGKHASDLGGTVARGTVAASGSFSIDISSYGFSSTPRVSLELEDSYQTSLNTKTVRFALLETVSSTNITGRVVTLDIDTVNATVTASDDSGTVHWIAVEA